jgi:hypothetical protein
MYKANVIVLFSGGMGSFLAAKAAIEASPDSTMTFYFNDTLVERRDLYRFSLDAMNHLDPSENYSYLKAVTARIPAIHEDMTKEEMEKRKKYLQSWGSLMMLNYPQYVYDADGRDVWDIFAHERYIGNSRMDPCSKILKRRRSSAWISRNFSPESADVAIGIDWSEKHRFDRAKKRWDFNLVAPLIDLRLDKSEYEEKVLLETGIQRSEAYDMGLAHDNCGGFCVKAGLGHFKLLLENDRSRYLYHERRLEEAMDDIGRHPFLTKMIKRKRYYVTMREYREYIETGRLVVNGETLICDPEDDAEDEMDFGGCGCAI